MRIALLSYRSKPHVGGQGVYVSRLSKALVEQGHRVEVFSGQPYPDLDPRVGLTCVPSLDLYRDEDPFRTPRPSEIRDLTDVGEVLTMWTAGFPEPRTFGTRVARILRDRTADFDVVHDNQSLSYGLLRIELPLVATVHHPITRDRALDLAAAPWRRRITVRRWYGFLTMQRRVARRIPQLLTVSQSSAVDIVDAFGVDPAAVSVVPLGVDTTVFSPRSEPRVAGRIVAVASADVALKGVRHLLEAVAKIRTERAVELQLVSKIDPAGPTRALIDDLAIGDIVHIRSGLDDGELAEVLASADVACVPSLYEGFSLPTIEAMACATPLVVSRTGAIPEVVGGDGLCADLVPPGDSDKLARALIGLLDDEPRRRRMGDRGRERAMATYSWPAVAAATVARYEAAIADRLSNRGDR
ncbi:MAG: glycosyltransferase family 4 protein [Rhodococcus sp. (in: high G+C Gram-positive bacteria)]